MKHIFESRITAIMVISGTVTALASVLLLWLIINSVIPRWIYEVDQILYFAGIILLFFGLYFDGRMKKHRRKEKEVKQ